jgi:hypothetical protein
VAVTEASRSLKLPEAAFLGFENTFHQDFIALAFNSSKAESGITTSHLTSKCSLYVIVFGIFLIVFTFTVTSSHSIQFHLVIA